MKTNTKDKKQYIRYNVFCECINAMRLPIFLSFLTNIIEELLLLLSADILGDFADSVFKLEFDTGLKNMIILAVCIMATVIIVPVVGLCSDFVMFKKSLYHDNIVFGHYLDKIPEKSSQLDAGKTQFELEDAPNTLRIKLVVLASKALAIPIGLGYLIYNAFKISWILTILMFVLASIQLIIPLLIRKKVSKYDVNTKEYQAKRRSYETDIITNPCIIRILGIENPIIKRIENIYFDYHHKTERKYIACQVLSQQFLNSGNSFIQILLLISGAILVARDVVTPGQLTSMLIYLTITITLLSYIGEIIHDYPLMKNALNRVSIYYQDVEHVSGELISHFNSLTGHDISFSFGEKKVLSNINFYISKGEKICFVGKNGCGKSTLCKIITGLIQSYSGVLSVDDTDIKQLNINELRKLIAYSPQVPYLFQTSVKENIAIGNPLATQDRINKLMDMFSLLPLAEREVHSGFELSGGERQKISIARALLKDAPLLILDEPTNHMDQKSVFALLRYINETNQTVIVISHDPDIQQITRKIEV